MLYTNSQIKFKTSILKSNLCDYSDVHILVKGTIIVGRGAEVAVRQANERNKIVIFKNYAPFDDCIGKINNSQIDNGNNLDVVMSCII